MVVQMSYRVTAKRWKRGWELHIDGVGVTQCRTARERVAEAQRAQKEAAELSRAAAQHLRDAGLSVSDSAFVMGLSRGRVSQLVG